MPALPTRLNRFARPALAAAAMAAALAGLLGQETVQAFSREKVMESAARYGSRTQGQARAMLQMVDRAAGLAEEQRLAVVNDFFNQRIQFRSDAEVWGRVDYWASPLEFLDKGQGDCEDYAIAKYFSLVAAGVPQARLRMVYVYVLYQGTSQAHMVLAYYAQPDAEPLILDNIQPVVRPASLRGDLTPVFSFNGEGLWEGVGATSKGDPMVRLSPWRELLAKVKAEGF